MCACVWDCRASLCRCVDRRLVSSASTDFLGYMANAFTNGLATILAAPTPATAPTTVEASSAPPPQPTQQPAARPVDEAAAELLLSAGAILPARPSTDTFSNPGPQQEQYEVHEESQHETEGGVGHLPATVTDSSTSISAQGVSDGIIPQTSSVLVDDSIQYCCSECDEMEIVEEKLFCENNCEVECIHGEGFKKRSRKSRRHSSSHGSTYAFPLVDPSLPPALPLSSNYNSHPSSPMLGGVVGGPPLAPPMHYNGASSHHVSTHYDSGYAGPLPPATGAYQGSAYGLADVVGSVPFVGPTLNSVVGPLMNTVDSVAGMNGHLLGRLGGGSNYYPNQHRTRGGMPFSHQNDVRPCCAECVAGDLYCMAHCQRAGCKPTAMCDASGRGAYASYCQERCKWISGFSFTEFLPDRACRGACAGQVQRLCAVDACQEYGCYAPECTEMAPRKCG
eukprot:GHVT01014020.1.p1 GENE.GHVT01014020.1~~GHVT01014020.1.p1  ORF type:complete len:450 (+),score=92.06 GHVT01014020.1:1420-2769(+)